MTTPLIGLGCGGFFKAPPPNRHLKYWPHFRSHVKLYIAAINHSCDIYLDKGTFVDLSRSPKTLDSWGNTFRCLPLFSPSLFLYSSAFYSLTSSTSFDKSRPGFFLLKKSPQKARFGNRCFAELKVFLL